MTNRRILLCLQRRFYGPRERKMGLLAFMRLGVWLSGVRAFRKGFIGNVLGEGFVLGGVFVIGRGQQVNLNLIKNWHKMCLYRFDLSNLYVFYLFFFSCREYYWSTERRSSGIKSTFQMSSKQSEKYHSKRKHNFRCVNQGLPLGHEDFIVYDCSWNFGCVHDGLFLNSTEQADLMFNTKFHVCCTAEQLCDQSLTFQNNKASRYPLVWFVSVCVKVYK